jgi:arsenate reductase (thioredoxin)
VTDKQWWDGRTTEVALALHDAALRLRVEFDGIFNAETIERYLRSSYDRLAPTSKVPTWVPLLTERFVRDRLTALGRLEGTLSDDRPVVLFLCTHNAGRSQMALGFFRALVGDRAIAWSGGSEPGAELNLTAVRAMTEVGIDITGEFPKPWTDEVVRAADVVVTMGCGDACPVFPGKRYEDWDLADPEGLQIEAVRVVRDEIKERVHDLLARLNILVT